MSSLAVHQLITLHTTRRHRTGQPADTPGPDPCIHAVTVSGHGGDCAVDPAFGSLDEALRVRAAHSGHTPMCPQYLGAIAYLGGLHDDSYE